MEAVGAAATSPSGKSGSPVEDQMESLEIHRPAGPQVPGTDPAPGVPVCVCVFHFRCVCRRSGSERNKVLALWVFLFSVLKCCFYFGLCVC